MTGPAFGCPATAVLLVNNVPDRAADHRAGRRPLAALLEPGMARWLYALPMLLPFAVLALAWGWRSPGIAWLSLRFARLPAGPAMNVQLGQVALAQIAFGALL